MGYLDELATAEPILHFTIALDDAGLVLFLHAQGLHHAGHAHVRLKDFLGRQ